MKINGLLAFVMCAAFGSGIAQANVINGGFETGDFTGWTLSGNTGFTGVSTNSPQSGAYAAYLGAVSTLDYLSQNVSTVAGTAYTLGYWLESDGGTPNEFSVSWDGTVLSDLHDIGSQRYTHYVFDVVATGASSLLTFGSRDDPGFLHLDSVSVNSVLPEPASLALFGIGLAGLGAMRRNGKKS
ncbi:MAG TPA: PEP-CTERM sorting domain-containing protein [Burkholderiales bacterium]|nr:PEP-CTERM sorting domain-containing protein [Burkholderiales bacterium]